MEVTVCDHDNLPEGAVVSVRFGTTRRQAPLETVEKHPLKFPLTLDSCSEPLKIDVLQPVASARLVLHAREEQYRIGLDTKNKRYMAIGLNVQHSRDASVSRMSNVADADMINASTPVPVVPLKYQEAAAAAREYLEAHGLLRYVQALLHAVLQERPEDPYRFMMAQLAAANSIGGAKQSKNRNGGEATKPDDCVKQSSLVQDCPPESVQKAVLSNEPKMKAEAPDYPLQQSLPDVHNQCANNDRVVQEAAVPYIECSSQAPPTVDGMRSKEIQNELPASEVITDPGVDKVQAESAQSQDDDSRQTAEANISPAKEAAETMVQGETVPQKENGAAKGTQPAEDRSLPQAEVQSHSVQLGGKDAVLECSTNEAIICKASPAESSDKPIGHNESNPGQEANQQQTAVTDDEPPVDGELDQIRLRVKGLLENAVSQGTLLEKILSVTSGTVKSEPIEDSEEVDINELKERVSLALDSALQSGVLANTLEGLAAKRNPGPQLLGEEVRTRVQAILVNAAQSGALMAAVEELRVTRSGDDMVAANLGAANADAAKPSDPKELSNSAAEAGKAVPQATVSLVTDCGKPSQETRSVPSAPPTSADVASGGAKENVDMTVECNKDTPEPQSLEEVPTVPLAPKEFSDSATQHKKTTPESQADVEMKATISPAKENVDSTAECTPEQQADVKLETAPPAATGSVDSAVNHGPSPGPQANVKVEATTPPSMDNLNSTDEGTKPSPETRAGMEANPATSAPQENLDSAAQHGKPPEPQDEVDVKGAPATDLENTRLRIREVLQNAATQGVLLERILSVTGDAKEDLDSAEAKDDLDLAEEKKKSSPEPQADVEKKATFPAAKENVDLTEEHRKPSPDPPPDVETKAAPPAAKEDLDLAEEEKKSSPEPQANVEKKATPPATKEDLDSAEQTKSSPEPQADAEKKSSPDPQHDVDITGAPATDLENTRLRIREVLQNATTQGILLDRILSVTGDAKEDLDSAEAKDDLDSAEQKTSSPELQANVEDHMQQLRTTLGDLDAAVQRALCCPITSQANAEHIQKGSDQDKLHNDTSKEPAGSQEQCVADDDVSARLCTQVSATPSAPAHLTEHGTVPHDAAPPGTAGVFDESIKEIMCLQQTIDSIKQDNESLHGKVDCLASDIQSLKKSNEDLVSKITARVDLD